MNARTDIRQLTLFVDDGAVHPLLPLNKAKTAPRPLWDVSDHACRYCFGRVLIRIRRGKVVEARCAECDQRLPGAVDNLCCCGVEAGALGRALECVPNPAVNAEAPQKIMVRERRATPKQSTSPRVKPGQRS